MSEDTGLWLVNGKVCGVRARNRVWAAWNKLWDAWYDKREKLEAKHRKQMAKLEKERDKVMKQEPLTPWVGLVDEGPVEKFIEQAKRDVAIHERQHTTTHSTTR